MNRQMPYIALLSGVVISSVTPLRAAGKEMKPNIILINIDDLGWADVGYNGSKYYQTPHIDDLHQRGVSFNIAYAVASNSAPSRASMLSGLYTPRHGVYTVNPPARGKAKDRKLIPAANNKLLPDSITILPMVLRQEGYATAHVGKWHVGVDPLSQGMDINIGGNQSGHPKTYFAPYKNPNLKDGPVGECLITRLGNEAANYIDTVSNKKPFFLHYAPYAVHTPMQANDSLIAKYKLKQETKAHHNPTYAAMVETMDRTIGVIMDAVAERRIAEQTLIVFTSDNGGVYSISKQWPLRAGKGSFYEGGIREPFVIYQKGRFEGDKYDDLAVSHLDLFPTFMDIIDASSSEVLDGLSLLSLLEQRKVKKLKNRALYWHFPAYLEAGNNESRDLLFRSRPVSVVRYKGWKLIENYEDGSLELYDLSTDQSEKRDLSTDQPRRVKQLYKMLNKWKRDTDAALPQKL